MQIHYASAYWVAQQMDQQHRGMLAFAEDAVLRIVSKFPYQIGRIFEDSYNIMQWFMLSVDLKFVDHGSEAVVFPSRKKIETNNLDVGDCVITSLPQIRYLGMVLDARLSFKYHVKHAADTALMVAMTMTRLKLNIGDPRQSDRKLLASVVNSVLTYGIIIWRDAMQNHKCVRKLTTNFFTNLVL